MAAAVLRRAQPGLHQLIRGSTSISSASLSRADGAAAQCQAATAAFGRCALPCTRQLDAWSPDVFSETARCPDLDASRWKRARFAFLGAPGVGKGTYASRLARMLDVPHISMGDLVRAEFHRQTAIGQKIGGLMQAGRLVPDSLVLEMLRRRLAAGAARGEAGFILDGFPRNTAQAEALQAMTPVDVALNVWLPRHAIVAKCVGRRACAECGGSFNVAGVDAPPAGGQPALVLPARPPPPRCAHKMTRRPDDTEEVVRARLAVYESESKPVEDYFRTAGCLVDFEVLGGIQETWQRLLETLQLEQGVVLPKAARRMAA